MRKQVIRAPEVAAAWDENWLDLDKAASVEVTEAGRGSRRGDSKEFAQHKMVREEFRHHHIGIPALSSHAQRGL